MNTLLIHNDNLPQEVMDIFGNKKLKYDIQSSHVIEQDFTFDKYASAELGNVLTRQQFDAIYVVINLNKNDYLEFTGLSIANHIRLSQEWNHSHTPIVILSPHSIENVSRIADNYEVLYTPGIFFESEFTLEAIEKIYEFIKGHFRVSNFNLLTEEDYQKYLKEVRIDPPGHFDGQHSIDNELTLYHWSKAIGINNIQIENEIGASLYFKFINQTNPVKTFSAQSEDKNDIEQTFNQNFENLVSDNKIENGRILLIDDQWQRGWEIFYKKFPISTEFQFDKIPIIKGDSYQKIQTLTKEKIKSFKPHVILLDLRLIDTDFNVGVQIQNVSGFKLLKYIHSQYPAIQIIITTASTKASTYAATMNYAFSYVQKTISVEAEKIFIKLKDDIENGIFLSQSLNDYFDQVKKIEKNISDYQKETISQVKHNLNISSELLLRAGKTKKSIFNSYAYLQLFHVLESFVKDCSVYKIENDSFFVINNRFKYLTVCKVEKQLPEAKQNEKIEFNDKEALNKNDFQFKRAVNAYKRGLDENFELTNSYHTLNNKITEILIFRHGLKNALSKKWNGKNWQKLNKLRNDFAHGNNSNDIDLISIQALVELISFLTNIHNLTTEDLTEYDLSEKSIEDKLNALIKKNLQ
jgi:DNA-binding NarL/FixJ family response regulator